MGDNRTTSPHAFATLGGAPLVVDENSAYVCICGMRGAYEVVERHIVDSLDTAVEHHASPIDVDIDIDGGGTQAHYLPNAPRKPAAPLPCRSRGCLAPLNSAGTCTVHIHEIEPVSLPPVSLPPLPALPIAELFQDMLRQAFEAGLAATSTGEVFEQWYAREVLA